MKSPAELEQILADFVITANILGALKVAPQIPVNGVVVNTKDGAVTLNGSLQWEFQLGIVNSVVEKIAGVKELNNRIALVPSTNTGSIWSFSAN